MSWCGKAPAFPFAAPSAIKRQLDALKRQGYTIVDHPHFNRILRPGIPTDVCYFEPLDREHFVVALLDNGLLPIGWNVVSIGTLE